MEEPKIETQPTEKVKQETKWSALTQKVYELELLISGAGIYLFANLPHFLDGIWQYYEYNFLQDDNIMLMISKIAFIILKSSAFLLWISFMLHFVLRAFWVSMIGMMNIFPEGINYQKMPKKYTPAYIDFLKKKILTNDDFIAKIDKWCSSILTGVFFMVLNLVNVSLLYILIIITSEIGTYFLKFNNAVQDTIFFICITILMAFLPILLHLLGFLIRREKIQNIKYEAFWGSKIFLLFGTITYRLSLVFISNFSQRKVTYFSTLFFLILGILSSILVDNTLQRTFNMSENYFYTNYSDDFLHVDAYENLRNPEKYVKQVSIQSEMISQKQLKIFLAYPKILENHLHEKLNYPKRQKDESKEDFNKKRQKIALDFWEKFFQIYVNDSLIAHKGLVFQSHARTNAKGFGAYIHIPNLKIGKNTLSVKIPKNLENLKKEQSKEAKKPEKDMLWAEIPFWYYPSN